jgi:hypothetical protein
MGFIKPTSSEQPADAPQLFDVVDEEGHVQATGVLEVDVIPGATRLNDIRFVRTDAPGQPVGIGQLLSGNQQ